MCGRYYSPDEAAMERAWHVGARSNQNPFRGVYNAAPNMLLPVPSIGAGGALELAMLRWGFLPVWASQSKPQINARAETVGVKPMFRAAFKNGRCLVPAAGWYRWTTIGGENWPHYISRRDGELVCFAGIEARGAKGERNYAIITTNATGDLRWLHDRMPVVLEREAQERWLTETGRGRVREMLRPAPAGAFQVIKVSKRVNSPKNNDAQLIESVE